MSTYPENPVLVEYRRGEIVESIHRGAYAIVQGDRVLESRGAIDHAYYFRSVAKPFQAIPLVESGAAAHFKLQEEELALIAASHNGEDTHRDWASSILKKVGLEEKDLLCGTHAPFDGETACQLRVKGEKASAFRHNCSGKHGGMLMLAKYLKQSTASYLDPESEGQKQIRKAISELCQFPEKSFIRATDGCSAPTYAIPLKNLALGYARFTNPKVFAPPLKQACETLRSAVAKHPYLLAGRKQFDTELVQATKGRLFAKKGAEGIYGIGIAGEKTGIALKVDDGSNRIHPFFLVSLLKRHQLLKNDELEALKIHLDSVQKNFSGKVVGEMKAYFG